jgi:hypothetical protein
MKEIFTKGYLVSLLVFAAIFMPFAMLAQWWSETELSFSLVFPIALGALAASDIANFVKDQINGK